MLSIYNYEDPIQFISSYISFEQSKSEDFSLRQFASELGLKSPAPLIDILKRKKKLKGTLAKKITDRIGIDNSERMYFEAITAKAYATSEESERMYKILMESLSPKDKEDFSVLRTSEIDIFSHWIYMAILSLSELDNFSLTVENIRKKLAEDLDPKLIESSLLELFSYGILITGKDGVVRVSNTRITTQSDKKHNNVKSYYSLVCDLAKKAIDVPLEYREFNTFSFPIAKNDISMAKEIIRKCRNDLSKLSRKKNLSEVYQANLMLFPLSNIEESKKALLN